MKCILSQPVHSDEAAHQLIQRLLVGDSGIVIYSCFFLMIIAHSIPSDTHVWSYVFMCGTSGQYFWTYILNIHSGAEGLYACC